MQAAARLDALNRPQLAVGDPAAAIRCGDLDPIAGGLDRSYVARIEAGLRNPSTKALAKLARALGVTLSALFEDVG